MENPRPFRIAHLTDIHVREGDAYEGFVLALQAATSAGAEAIVLGGDTVMNSVNSDLPRVEAQWAEYRRAVDGFPNLTVFPCLGNQDVWGWNQKMSGCRGDEPRFGKGMFLHQMGIQAPFYAARLGAWRLIVLDSIQRGGRHGFYASLDPVQRGWLEAELMADVTVPTVVVTHIPIVPGPAEFFALNQLEPDRSGNWSLPDHVVHRDSHDLASLFERFPNVRLCLAGHTHVAQSVTLWDTTYVVSPPVAGAWWRGDFLGKPRGFSLVDLHPDGAFHIETRRL